MSKNINRKEAGFTLLELLIVIGIIAILATVVILAINPGRQFAQARNADRWSSVNTYSSLIYQLVVDQGGTFPTLPATATQVCKTGTLEATCTSGGLLNLSVLVSGGYTTALDVDPICNTCDDCHNDNGTGYYVHLDAENRLNVEAKCAELTQTIKVIQ